MPAATDIMTPLWRGVVVLRIITAAFAVGAIIVHHGGFDRPDLGWAALAAIVIWTVLTCLAYSDDRTRRSQVILVDLLVTLALTACSALVLSPEQLTESTQRAPLLPTIWACGPVVAAAVHAGRLAGALFGTVTAAMEIWLRGSFTTDLACDALLLIGTGFVLGMAATAARQATEQLRRAARAEAATAERERLARSIHDGVVQVLARVRSRGGQLDGEAAELARLAGEQEIALRSLLSTQPPDGTGGQQDLAGAIQLLASPQVEVSLPATPVLLASSDVDELTAVVREALSNTSRHGGPEAKSWVLVEDLGTEVVLTVRDNGPGINTEQLVHAESDGRMGVSRSIRGRVADLGGTLTLDTGPGRGTQWEVRLGRVSHGALR
ncbi:MAG: ATP-binding protein [Pseudonocardiales bacterium]|nr:ATP-binding protein [Pseudonocardiales bacterium]MBV9652212.1 ATP-binding protein [Pseudonocardiales bacterium]